MTPPKATGAGITAGVSLPSAVSVCVQVMAKRSEFLKAARARRQAMPGFILQARRRGADEIDSGLIRIGFTCSKKLGNAVARNRAKRRLREIARMVLPGHGQPGWDYVLIGRRDVTASRDFADLVTDLQAALAKTHGTGK